MPGKSEKARDLKGFTAGYPPAEKRDGTLSRISSHHGIGSVDMYLYARDWRLFRKINFSVLHNSYLDLQNGYRGDFLYGLSLFDRKTLHQPFILLGSQSFHFNFAPGPLEPTFFKALIEEQETVTFKQESLDPVCSPATEEEQYSCKKGIQMKAVLNQSRQTVNAQPHIRISAGYVNL
jgi:hypothetical protein